jgi:hypothetical protein
MPSGRDYRFTTFAAALSLPATSTCATYTPAPTIFSLIVLMKHCKQYH